MIRFIGSLPQKAYVAVSGGADSMAILHFLTRHEKRDITVLHYDHGTDFGSDARKLVEGYCLENEIPYIVGEYTGDQPTNNKECIWRDNRYKFFSYYMDRPIILAHHLNDAAETYLFTAIHGNPQLIPYQRDNIIRPFLLTEGQKFKDWCDKFSIPYLNDPCNENREYMRSIIRHDIMPLVESVNAGFLKVIRKKYSA